MECNKDEAKRAMDIAEKKLSENDYVGAKKFVSKAQNLYPQLDGLEQVSMMIHVYTSAANKINGGRATDWYGVLGVDPLADDEALKKQYKKLALLLHPDKNKCKGAEGAFKLVLNAWYLLSDKVKRTAYDQKRKSSTGVQKPPPNQHKPDSSNGKQNARDGVDPNARARSNHPASGPQKPPNPHKPAFSSVNQNARDGVHPRANTRNNKPAPAPAPVPAPAPAPVPAPAPAPAPGPEPVNPSKQRKDGIFWTMCNGCKTRSQFRRDRYLNKTIACLNCGQDYTATEKNPWDVHVRFFNDSLSRIRQRQQQWSAQNQATNKNTNGASSSGTSSSPFVGATEKNHLWESYVTQVNSALSLVRQQQQQWNSQNQAANNNTNEASTSGTSSSPYVGATPQERFALQQLYSALYLLKLKQQWSAQKQAANNNWRSTSPSVSATGKAPHASVVRPGNLSSSSPQQQQQQQRSAKSQATNTFTNGASSLRTNSSPFVSATQETPQASAKSQETNKNTTGASSSGRVSSPYVSATAKTPPGSFVWPGANLSSSPQQQLLQQQRQQLLQQQRQLQQQWKHKLQQQCGAQNTSGGTYYPSSSSARGSSPSVNATGKTPPGRFVWPGVNFSSSPQQQWGAQNTSGGTCYPSSSGSSHQDFSVSVTASSNSGNAANQAQETSKRGLEDSQETLAAAERLFKKPRTDVT